VYSLLRSAGMSTVTALVLSGVFPALGVAIGVEGPGTSDADPQPADITKPSDQT